MSTPTPAADPAAPLTVPLNQLLPHPAQMRVQYDLDSLAALTLQLHQRGLDAWQPILVSQKETGYHIVSGHRRHMGLLLSLALQDWADKRGDNPEITVEIVRMALSSFIEQIGSLEQVVASLRQKYGEREIPVMRFNGGGQKEEILALQAANYGGEQPDMLGVARSFQQAVEAGATEAEIARNSGQHPHYVRNHLALTQIPAELAQRIASGELPMSLAAIVADLPEPKRTGLAIYLLANPFGRLRNRFVGQWGRGGQERGQGDGQDD
jgi:ParB-like chromosome segregation protein Spo0J